MCSVHSSLCSFAVFALASCHWRERIFSPHMAGGGLYTCVLLCLTQWDVGQHWLSCSLPMCYQRSWDESHMRKGNTADFNSLCRWTNTSRKGWCGDVCVVWSGLLHIRYSDVQKYVSFQFIFHEIEKFKSCKWLIPMWFYVYSSRFANNLL